MRAGARHKVPCPGPQRTLQNLWQSVLALRKQSPRVRRHSRPCLARPLDPASGQETLAGLPLWAAGEAHTPAIPPDPDPEEDDFRERPPAQPRAFNRVFFSPN